MIFIHLFGVVYMYMNFTVYMNFPDLHHSGTQFFLGNVDIFLDPGFLEEPLWAPTAYRTGAPRS